jgi:hypothetical protein
MGLGSRRQIRQLAKANVVILADTYYLQESDTPEYLLNTTAQAITLTRSKHASLTVDIADPQTGMTYPMPLPLAINPVERGTSLLSSEQIALKLLTQVAKWQRTMKIVYTVGYMPENLVEVVIEQYDLSTANVSTPVKSCAKRCLNTSKPTTIGFGYTLPIATAVR